jgi:hypothetical protein
MNIKRTGSGVRLACAVILTIVSASCGDMARDGQASSYLIISGLTASAGGPDAGTFGGDLRSDVLTNGSVFNDNGQVDFRLGMKDPLNPTAPTSANFITIDRYHVRYIRADGRNTEGVDVPYAFDGAITGTVSGLATFTFTLVRHQAKEEAPLRALQSNPFLGIIVSTIAEVTFYGHDQTGRAVSVMGKISIHFADFGDPT